MNKGKIGLLNRGNTCYLNTSIQCLSHLPLLTEFFMTDEYLPDLNGQKIENDPNNEKCISLTAEYSKLIKGLWKLDASIDPKSFHTELQKYDSYFVGFEQQDSQESLSLIIDAFHESLKYESEIGYYGTIKNKYDKITVESINNFKDELNGSYSKIVELFFGQYINQIVSYDTKKILSKKFERFNNLSIPIYGKTLYDSLSKYCERELLEDKFLDEKTNKKVQAYKQLRMVRIPKYLIIFLKRYSENLKKLNSSISFPIENLDLTPYCDGYDSITCDMKLISVGCHIGNINGGHYYAVCRHTNNNWYKYDDTTVSEYDINLNCGDLFKNGYILIYEKFE